jgi:hypothetical protein
VQRQNLRTGLTIVFNYSEQFPCLSHEFRTEKGAIILNQLARSGRRAQSFPPHQLAER